MRTLFWVLFLGLAAAPLLSAIEVIQVAGAAHAYPIMLDLAGKKLGPGEYVQEVEGGRLKVRITYHLSGGRVIEEKGTFVQRPEFAQKEWSWQERHGETIEREYAIHFDAQTATAQKQENGKEREWSEKIAVEPAHTFAGFGFTLVL